VALIVRHAVARPNDRRRSLEQTVDVVSFNFFVRRFGFDCFVQFVHFSPLSSVRERSIFSLGAVRSAAKISIAARACAAFKFYGHHEVGEPVARPAAEPRDFPIAEARADRDWRAKVQKLSFQLHGVDLRSGGSHSQVEIRFRRIEQFTWLLVERE